MHLINFIPEIFIIYFYYFSFSVSNVTALIDDDALLAFLRGPNSFDKFYTENALILDQSKELLAQRFEAHLGALHFMRWHWHCNRIGKKFKAHEKKRCKKFRHQLHSVYYYLLGVFAEFPALKPEFLLKKQHYEKVGTLCDTLSALCRIWKFYFEPEFGKSKEYRLDKLFTVYYKPKLTTTPNARDSSIVQMDYAQFGDIPANARVPMWIKFDAKLRAMRGDEEFVAFVKGETNAEQQQFAIKIGVDHNEQAQQMYDARLGALYVMREHWQCANIGQTFERHERRECQKYRRQLDTVYEYLFRMFASIPTLRPNFMLKKRQQDEENDYYDYYDGALSEVIQSLAKVAKFFFDPEFGQSNEFKLQQLFENVDEPKLQVNNGKVPSPPNVLTDNAKVRQKFDQKMKTIIDDDEFVEFVKALPNTEQFYEEKRTESNESGGEGIRTKSVAQQCLGQGGGLRYGPRFYEAQLGVLYLMKKNWQCAKVVPGFEKKQGRKECLKYRKHLDILYEYLFRLYAPAAVDHRLAIRLPAVMPKFQLRKQRQSLANVVYNLNKISMFLFDAEFSKKYEHKMQKLFNESAGPRLTNERELNYGTIGQDWDNDKVTTAEDKVPPTPINGKKLNLNNNINNNNNNKKTKGKKATINVKKQQQKKCKWATQQQANDTSQLAFPIGDQKIDLEKALEAKGRQKFDGAMKRMSQLAKEAIKSKFVQLNGASGPWLSPPF